MKGSQHVIKRRCCGVMVASAALFKGSVRLTHAAKCRYRA